MKELGAFFRSRYVSDKAFISSAFNNDEAGST